MWRPAAVVTLPYPDWQPGNQSCDASEEDEQRQSPEAAGPAGSHPASSGSLRKLAGCFQLEHLSGLVASVCVWVD